MHFYYCLVVLLLQTFFINIANSAIFKIPEVKRIVELHKGHDDFSKYWPLFDQFLPCTIHFSRSLDGWLDMYNSFLERCRYLDNCTAFQTNYSKPGSKYSSILLEAWNRPEFEDLASTFWTVFLPHRFHQVCTVQLNFSCHDLVNAGRGDAWLFSSISPYKSYFVLPIDFKIDSKSSFLRYIYGPFLGTSKLIFLNQNITAAYIACFTCTTKHNFWFEIGQFGIMIKVSFDKIDFFFNSIRGIRQNLDLLPFQQKQHEY